MLQPVNNSNTGIAQETYALTKTNAMSAPFAALTARFWLLDKDVAIVAVFPMYAVSASMGGTTKSSKYDPEPHLILKKKPFCWALHNNRKITNPTTMVPSLHSFSSLHFTLGILASCPMIAIFFATPRTAGRPRIVVPLESPTRAFLSKTDEAEAISFASAVCPALRAFTSRFRGPLPSGLWASKLTWGKFYDL